MCAIGQASKHAIGADMKTNSLLGTTSVGGAPPIAGSFAPGTFATLLTARGQRGGQSTPGGGAPGGGIGGNPGGGGIAPRPKQSLL